MPCAPGLTLLHALFVHIDHVFYVDAVLGDQGLHKLKPVNYGSRRQVLGPQAAEGNGRLRLDL